VTKLCPPSEIFCVRHCRQDTQVTRSLRQIIICISKSGISKSSTYPCSKLTQGLPFPVPYTVDGVVTNNGTHRLEHQALSLQCFTLIGLAFFMEAVAKECHVKVVQVQPRGLAFPYHKH